jgi:pantothenate kinase
LVISADRWLKNAQEREAGVLGRYDIGALQSLVGALEDVRQRPDTLALPGYHKLRRERVDSVETVSLSRSDIILVEGTVCLGLRTTNKSQTHRFHIDIDEEARKQRVLREYGLRGLGKEKALEVYYARREDEFPFIEDLAPTARRVPLLSI